MSKKYPTELARINQDFEKRMRVLAKERYMRDLDIKELPLPEMTRIVMTAPSWENIEKELRLLPHKERKR